MFKKLIFGLLGLVVIIVVAGFALPKTAQLERSITIDAPKSVVFAVLNNFNWFNQWSPWYKLDPQAKIEISGKERGVGAKYRWQSDNQDVGTGSQKIVASVPYKSIETRLDFGPQGKADAFYKLTGNANSTTVTWGFDTDFGMNPIARYFGLLLETFLGPAYEEGLSNLKSLVENSLPKQGFADLNVSFTERKPLMLAYVSGTTTRNSNDIGQALGAAYAKVGKFISDNELSVVDKPVAITEFWNNGGYGFKAGIPINRRGRARPAGDVMLGELYAGKVMKIEYTGAYSNLTSTYKQIDAYIKANKITTNGKSWERYVSDPADTPEAELITEIYFPIK